LTLFRKNNSSLHVPCGLSHITVLSGLERLYIKNLFESDDVGLEYLKHLANLQYLYYGYNSMMDLNTDNHLGGHHFWENAIETNYPLISSKFISALKLKKLEIESCHFFDLDYLSNLTNIQEFSYSFCIIPYSQNLHYISQLQKLKILKLDILHNENKRDLYFISKLTNIRELYLRNVSIMDLNFMPKLTQVQKLDIRYSNVNSSVLNIANLSIRTLLINNCMLSLADVEQLSLMRELRELKISSIYLEFIITLLNESNVIRYLHLKDAGQISEESQKRYFDEIKSICNNKNILLIHEARETDIEMLETF